MNTELIIKKEPDTIVYVQANNLQPNALGFTGNQDIFKNKGTRLYLILSSFFIANIIVAEFIGVKVFSLERTLRFQPVDWHVFGGKWSFDLTAGGLLWPFVAVLTNIINEYYGKKGVKFLSWLGTALIAYAFFMMNNAMHLTAADWWINSQQTKGVPNMNLSFNAVFGQGMGIVIGSLTAFIVSQICDVSIFKHIKKRTGEKHLWLRMTGSTILSQLIDSMIVVFIAFYFYPLLVPGNASPWTINQVIVIGLGGYLYKFIVAILMTPVTYAVHHAIERHLGAPLASHMKQKAILN